MNDLLDTLILAAASERWQKVARIIALVSQRTGDDTQLETIAEGIQALVTDGKLEAKGDLSRWGYSEVRRAQSHPGNS